MNCLVIAATPIEIRPLLEKLKEGNIPISNSIQLDVLITGIGLLATSYSLQKQIQLKRPDLIIQAGVGGCFDKKMKLGRVFIIKKEAIADQSVVELNALKTLFDLDLVPANQPPYQKGWLVNPHSILKKLRLPKVTGISVNEITTQPQKVRFYKKQFNPLIESMEGAALHYVALQEGIPFIQLRSTSNYIAERNKKNWNMPAAIHSLNQSLLNLLQVL
ncbi:MAG: futalosine hydrolase [Terrimonas sp.]|jgi:futalosine hydrolase|nr:futalosine hydrolase [Terrimonas sp.]